MTMAINQNFGCLPNISNFHHMMKTLIRKTGFFYIKTQMISVFRHLTGVVEHPSEWSFCGYNEIQDPPQRYTLIDYEKLMNLFQLNCYEELKYFCKSKIDEAICEMDRLRNNKWTESIAVGSEKFIEVTKNLLGFKAIGRKKVNNGKGYELREPPAAYNTNFIPENEVLRVENTYYWDGNSIISGR